MKHLIMLVAAAMLSACALAETSPTTSAAAESRGEAIARENCATCHAVGRSGDSPAPEAPPFRYLAQNYRVDTLQEALAEGISVGHPAMPNFAFAPEDVDALIGYLQSIQSDDEFVAAGEAEPSDTELIADGREIAMSQCSSCHAVGTYGESPRPEAPTFRTVLSRYRSDVLEEELITGIRVNHQMPDFHFNPQGADALIAYLESIQATE